MAGVAQAPPIAADNVTFDLAKQPLRELNQFLHHGLGTTKNSVDVLNPDGAHNIAAGVECARGHRSRWTRRLLLRRA